MKINIERLNDILGYIALINSRPLSEIELYQHGHKVEVSAEAMEQWKFIGLNNVDFIKAEFYNEYPKKSPDESRL